MGSPAPLPDALRRRAAFTVAEASRLDVGRDRLGRCDLVQPYHGLRAHEMPSTHRARADVHRARLRPGQVFSHATAAVLLGMPIPRALREGPLHVAALHPAQAPRTRGVVGHRLVARPGLLDPGGGPMTGAGETWCQLAADLDVAALVAAGDHLVRHGVERPEEVLGALDLAVRAVRRTGARSLAEVLQLVRPGVRSPMESLLRVVLVQAGLPEPEVNAPILDSRGRFLGEGDLVYRRARQVLEYEGDGHRTERRQFMKDIRRREVFADAGWDTTRITAEDVFVRREALIARVAHRIGHRPSPRNARPGCTGTRVLEH